MPKSIPTDSPVTLDMVALACAFEKRMIGLLVYLGGARRLACRWPVCVLCRTRGGAFLCWYRDGKRTRRPRRQSAITATYAICSDAAIEEGDRPLVGVF